MKQYFKNALNKIQDTLTDPKVTTFVSMGEQALHLAAMLGQANLKGPTAVAGTAIGIFNWAAKGLRDLKVFNDTVDRIVLENKMRQLESRLFTSLFSYKEFLKQAHPLLIDDVNEKDSAKLLEIKKGEHTLYLMVDEEGEIENAYISENGKVEYFLEVLWEKIGNYLELNFQEDRITLSPISFLGSESYSKSALVNTIMKKHEKYKNLGVNKAYLLYGPPGTGKTTFCFNIAAALGGKLLLITPALLTSYGLSYTDLQDIVTSFKPNVLLLEDIDKADESKLLLSVIDNIRHDNPSILMVSTANDKTRLTSALRRPSRLGIELAFSSPQEEERKQVIQLYMKKLSINRDITYLSQYMNHPQFSHDFIKEVCEQALIEDDEFLINYIESVVAEFGEAKEDRY